MGIKGQDQCYNSALDGERMFVLLARDACAPAVILYWVQLRIQSGKNQLSDPEIIEAIECATLMQTQRRYVRSALGKADS